MSDLLEAAKEIHAFCRRRKWQYCIIGGIAVARWGEPRATRDVDINLALEVGTERKLLPALLARFEPRVSDALEFALNNRIVLCKASNGVEIDIGLGGFPYDRKMIARATPFRFAPRCELMTCSAEDLIVLKAIAGRPEDWVAVKGIVQRQARLNWRYVNRELSGLCELKEDSSALDKLAAIRREEDAARELD